MPKNLVDSEVMMGILARGGYELTPRADEAEVLVVNTCSFIEARRKNPLMPSWRCGTQKIRRGEKTDRGGMSRRRFRAQILEQVPEVDAVVALGSRAHHGSRRRRFARVARAAAGVSLSRFDAAIVTTPKHAAYIKIAEGCDHPCTFCIIPELRGKFRSRRFESWSGKRRIWRRRARGKLR